MKRTSILLVAAALFTALGATQAAAITITSNSVEAVVSSGGSTDTKTFAGTSYPVSHLLNATIPPGSYSRVQIDYTGIGNEATFSNTLEQQRTGNMYDYSQGKEGSMKFTADATVSYEFSGLYRVTDVDVDKPGNVVLYSYLYDLTKREYSYRSDQRSSATANESFVMGGTGGDASNIFAGSLSGTLEAGHQYTWYWYIFTQASADTDSGASAVGNITMKIGGGAPSTGVPDSGTTVALLGLALGGLALVRRRIA